MLCLVGCTCNKQYRTDYTIAGHSEKSVIEVWDDFKLGVVEFDDQGCYWDPSQRKAVEQMIAGEAGLGQPIDQRHGIVLVVFVHGWKDNADSNNGTLNAFREILSRLKTSDRTSRKVVGVYVGWRGLSSTLEPFKEFSFFSRKETAFKVGNYGGLTQLLVDLENLQKQSLADLPPGSPRTELIIIGHSFGGAAVYSSLSQIMTERFINTVGEGGQPGDRMRSLGDQVILLNPAFEAMRFYDLYQLAASVNPYPIDQRPVLSIFTSHSDWATHWIFPIGQFVGTLGQANRPIKAIKDPQNPAPQPDLQQSDMQLQTVGWYGPFINHHLHYRPASPPTTRSSELLKQARDDWATAHRKDTFVFYPCLLEPELGKYRPRNPIIIADVDSEIMNGHNDIQNPRMIDFLWHYIQFTQPEEKDHSMYRQQNAK